MRVYGEYQRTSVEYSDQKLTLLVPGLLDQEEMFEHLLKANPPTVSEMEFLLARSVPKPVSSLCYEAELLRLFNVYMEEGDDMPVAPIIRLLETDEPEADEFYWMCADPVHMQPDIDDLIPVMGTSALNISAEESEQLLSELNDHFPSSEMVFESTSLNRWFVRLIEDPGIRTNPINEVMYRHINRFLPYGEQSMFWHSLMNEIQMLFFNSGVNHARMERGEATINSLWFWGGGKMPEAPYGDWAQIWGSEVLARGLAKLTYTPAEATPKNAGVWLNKAVAPGNHLIILDAGRNLSRKGEFEPWRQYLIKLNFEWFKPLLEALKAGKLLSLRVQFLNGFEYDITPFQLKQVWKRPRPLVYYFSRNENSDRDNQI